LSTRSSWFKGTLAPDKTVRLENEIWFDRPWWIQGSGMVNRIFENDTVW